MARTFIFVRTRDVQFSFLLEVISKKQFTLYVIKIVFGLKDNHIGSCRIKVYDEYWNAPIVMVGYFQHFENY